MNDETEQTARAVSDFVNRAGHRDGKALAWEMARDHRTLVQLKASVFMTFFRLLAEDFEAGRFDARNEAACQRAAVMVKALEEAGFDSDSMPFI